LRRPCLAGNVRQILRPNRLSINMLAGECWPASRVINKKLEAFLPSGRSYPALPLAQEPITRGHHRRGMRCANFKVGRLSQVVAMPVFWKGDGQLSPNLLDAITPEDLIRGRDGQLFLERLGRRVEDDSGGRPSANGFADPSGDRLARSDRSWRQRAFPRAMEFVRPGFASPVIFGEAEDSVLLGSVSLESLGLLLDPLKRVLRPLPMVLGRLSKEPSVIVSEAQGPQDSHVLAGLRRGDLRYPTAVSGCQARPASVRRHVRGSLDSPACRCTGSAHPHR